MSEGKTVRTLTRGQEAWLSIGGFACCQGFVYAVFFLGAHQTFTWGDVAVSRADLFGALICMAAALAVMLRMSPAQRNALLAPRVLVPLALLPLVGRIASALAGGSFAGLAFLCICTGFSSALLLCAWGRVLGHASIEQSVPEVFIGAALGAAFDFAIDAAPFAAASNVLYALPFASALFLYVLARAGATTCAQASEGVASAASPSEEATELTGRIILGTGVYGVAAGLVETIGQVHAETHGTSSLAFMLLLFVIYCLAALQLFGAKPLANMRAVLPSLARTNETQAGGASAPREGGPLDGAYRLAALLMMAGFLLMPVLAAFNLASDSVASAGYLGIFVVLASLFLVMGHISGRDPSLSFGRGFKALFIGEVAGVVLGNVIALLPATEAASLAAAGAGIAVLYGYLYLFTEHDLRALSVVVENTDRFDEVCACIARTAALSKREAEILPLALRGRTSERIAGELYITKNTVDTHMRRIYAKCGVHNRQELIDLSERTAQSLRR